MADEPIAQESEVYDIDEIITRMPTTEEVARLGYPPERP